MLSQKSSYKYRDAGLLLLRLGIGLMFMYHGYPYIMGGEAAWVKLGLNMKVVGITFMPVLWGFMAAFAMFAGGFLLVVGYMFRPACLLLAATMAVAAAVRYGTGGLFSRGGDLAAAAYPLEMGILFVSLLLIGAGKYSLEKN